MGDVDRALSRSDLVVEGHFSTPCVEHGYLEPESGTAFWSDDVLTVQAPTQFPFELKGQLAAVLDMPADKLRIQATPLGGGFGSKADATVEPLVALAAYCCKRPVKLRNNFV